MSNRSFNTGGMGGGGSEKLGGGIILGPRRGGRYFSHPEGWVDFLVNVIKRLFSGGEKIEFGYIYI